MAANTEITPQKWHSYFESLDSPLVLLEGDDAYLSYQAVQYVRRVFQAQYNDQLDERTFYLKEIGALDKLIEHCEVLPLLNIGGNRKLVLGLDLSALKAAALPGLIDYFDNLNPDVCLVLSAQKLDQRTALAKKLKKVAHIIPCHAPSYRSMGDWLREFAKQRNVSLNAQALYALQALIGNSLFELDQAIEKLSLYAGDSQQLITVDTINDVLARTNLNHIFRFLDMLSQRKLKDSLMVLDDLKQAREPEIKILFMLTRHFRTLFQARNMMQQRASEREIASALKVPPWKLRDVLAQARAFSQSALSAIYAQLVAMDKAFKSSGNPGWAGLENLVINITKTT